MQEFAPRERDVIILGSTDRSGPRRWMSSPDTELPTACLVLEPGDLTELLADQAPRFQCSGPRRGQPGCRGTFSGTAGRARSGARCSRFCSARRP